MMKRGSTDGTSSSSEPVIREQNSEKQSESEQSNNLWWNIMNKIKPTGMRSPVTTPRNSVQENYAGRRHSFMTPEMEQKIAQRRASLERLHVSKISPWMHLYDFSATSTSDE